MSEELKATEALLDIGVSVPLRPVRFHRWKWTPRVTVRRPPLGGLLRILRVWFKMETTPEELDKMDGAERLQFILAHGRAISEFVALTACSGFVSGKLLAPALAWFLRWRCHPDAMLYLVSEFMQLQDTKSFMTIIKLGAAVNIVAPRLSQKGKRS